MSKRFTFSLNEFFQTNIKGESELIADTMLSKSLALCVELTNGYDESHNVDHHICVFHNAIKILTDACDMDESKGTYEADSFSDEQIKEIYTLIFYSSLLHDTIDYKYPTNLELKLKSLENFLKENTPDSVDDILWIINNISHSKEVKYGYPVHSNSVVQFARNIVSDADKLESIGEIGLKRCFQYGRVANPGKSESEIKELVIKHCHEKLLKIKDHFIKMKAGLIYAKEGHQIIVDFIKSQENDLNIPSSN